MKLVFTMFAAVFFISTAIAQNVGIGTTTPANKLSVVGKMDISDSLGIGTTTPTAKLDVSGTTKTTNLQITGAPSNGFILVSDATGFARWANSATIESDPKVGTLTTNKTPRWNGLTLADGLVFDNGTNVGIGTITPAQKLDIAGTTKTTNLQITSGAANGFILKSDASGIASWANINSIETDPKVGTLTSNKIPKWNGTSLADGLVFDNGTNIGIGTITPAQKLDVAGTTKTTNLQITNGASNGYILKSDASGNASWANINSIETDPKVGTLTSNKIPKWNGNTLADGLLFDNGTNVGIGTTTPSRRLTVVNPFSIGIAELSGNPTANTSIGIGRTDVEGTLNVAGDTNEFANGTLPGDIVLRTESNTQRLILNSGNGAAALTILNGNTGIGTSSPTQKLDVLGTTKTINLQITNGASSGFILKSDLSGNASWVNASTTITDGTLTNNKIPKWNGTALTNGILFDNGTNIGIGTITPANKLSVSGNSDISGNLGIGTTTPVNKLSVSGNSDISGNLGIGTNTPANKLSVNGNSDISGNLGIGTNTPANKLSVNGKMDIADSLGIGTITPAGELHVKSGEISNSILDQQQTIHTNNGGNLINWQTFTAGSTGLLTRVDLVVKSPIPGSSSPGTIKIFLGEGTTGTLLSATAVTFQDIIPINFQSFTLSSFPAVIAGNKYTIEFSVPNMMRSWLEYHEYNPYAGGTGDYFERDYLFKTYVAAELDALVVADGQAKIAKLQITNGATSGFILKSDATGKASWVNAATVEGDPKVGTLSNNTIPKWNGTKLADGLIFDDGTKVGIGTILPAYKMTVVNPNSPGITAFSNSLTANTSIGIGRTNIDGSLNVAGNTNEFAIGTSLGDIVLRTESNTQRLILNAGNGAAAITVFNGNTGIGNTSPAEKLDVNGTTKTTSLKITSGAANGYVLKSDATGNASWANASTIETDPKVGTLTSNKIPKWNGTILADRLMFDNGINVGIGTSTPANKLSVNGNSDISGSLGIGTTAPEAKLHVASSNTGLRIDVPPAQTAFSIGGAGSVKVDAIGVEGGRLLINDNGNMGIGNNNPITTLDVNGGIRTKYSGSTVVDVVGGLVTTLNITIPAVPSDWNVDNTIVIVTNADGVDGIVRQAKLSSLTNIAVKYIQDINGLARLNWIILRQ